MSEFDASDYERPARRGVRGTIVMPRFVLHVAIYAERDAWTADSVVELANEAGAAQIPVKLTAATARDAWAAVSADVLRRLDRWAR